MTATKTGYQAFGSFHTESVDALLARDESSLPENPHVVVVEPPEFGASSRQHFLIDFNEWTFVNHGAFGAVLRPAMHESHLWREYCEKQPLKFLDRELFPHIVRVMKEIAPFLGADCKDFVLLPNATTGINTISSSTTLCEGDAVFMLDIGYGSVKKVLQRAAELKGAEVVLGRVTFPIRQAV